jgi:hypothetical protein
MQPAAVAAVGACDTDLAAGVCSRAAFNRRNTASDTSGRADEDALDRADIPPSRGAGERQVH